MILHSEMSCRGTARDFSRSGTAAHEHSGYIFWQQLTIPLCEKHRLWVVWKKPADMQKVDHFPQQQTLDGIASSCAQSQT